MNKSFGYYCLRYAGIMVLVMMAVAVLYAAAFAVFPDLSERYLSGNSGAGIITAIVPALLVGQVFYREERRKLLRGEGWKLALAFTVIGFLISVIALSLAVMAGAVDGELMRGLGDVWANGRDILLGMTAVFFVAYLLIIRLALRSGIRGAIKIEAKQAAKDARNG